MRSFKLPHLICVLALLAGGLVLPSDALAQRHRGRVVVARRLSLLQPVLLGLLLRQSVLGPVRLLAAAYGYYGGYYDYASDVRIMATPREAEVYVDGYLVGTVDDFDGWSQRLRIQPGEHEIELYLEGYRSVRQKMLFRPGETYKIRAALEKIAPGDEPAVRPVPAPGAAPATQSPSTRRHRIADIRRRRHPRRLAPHSAVSGPSRSACSQPTPSSSWTANAGIVPTAIRGSALSCRRERTRSKCGRTATRPYASTVQVRAGEVTTLNVSLPVEP